MSAAKYRHGTFSREDLELLGYQTVKEQDFENYAVFRASTPAGLEKIEATFVYIKSGYRNADAAEAKKHCDRTPRSYVVIPKTLQSRVLGLNMIFGQGAKILIHEDLIWEKIVHTFSDYLSRLKQNITEEQYYVAPRKEGADPKERLDDELLSILTDRTSRANVQITVVRAPAGVGKTTLSRHLTKVLAQRVTGTRVIPVFVESAHWGKLQISSLEDLWEMIDNSLRAYSPNLRISRSLFEHLLRQGYLAFLFDGFDELCTHRHSAFTPREVLDELLGLAKESLAKIMITTRTLFWEAAMGSDCEGIRVLDLASFNKQQAFGYFDNVFKKSPARQRRAEALYSRLTSHNKPLTTGGSRAQFFNHPVCVSMIAECVERGIEEAIEFQDNKSLLYQLLWQLCERERGRQALVTLPDLQLAAFEQVAVAENNPNSEGFEIEYCEAAGFDRRDVSKLIDHPLLSSGASTDGHRLYRFRYDFLPEFLRARFLVGCIRNFSGSLLQPANQAWEIMAQEASGKGTILEHMLPMLEPKDLAFIGASFATATRISGKAERSKSFLFHLARLAAEEFKKPVTKRERAELTLNTLFGDAYNLKDEVRRLHLSGQVDRMDFGGVQFVDCNFSDVRFVDCHANDKTKFLRCTFSGTFEVEGTDRKAWSSVVLDSCKTEFPTNLVWESLLKKGIGNSEQNIRDALKLAVGKFWRNGQIHLSINKVHWAKGPLGHSVHCANILDAMLSSGVLIEVTISGVTEGGYALTKESIHDVQRFMDNGQLRCSPFFRPLEAVFNLWFSRSVSTPF
jgi:hypothetical protein